MRLAIAFRRALWASILATTPSWAQGNNGKNNNGGPKKEKPIEVSADEVASVKKRTERLFGAKQPLEFSITTDYKAAFKNRDTLNAPSTPASLVIQGDSGKPVQLDIAVAPRGHFRIQSRNCPFPPIKLTFDKKAAKGTPFAGQHNLKLGTHCRPNDKEYEQYVIREYLVYKMYEMFTEVGLRARLARVTYVPKGDSAHADTRWGMLVESEEDMAARNSGAIRTMRGARFDDFNREQLTLVGLFAYMIGNTDWSMASLHNIRLLFKMNSDPFPVPYDFDWSGVVQTRYARPDSRLPIKTVQERTYRGPCRTMEELAPVITQMRDKRDAIRSLYLSQPDLDQGYAKWAVGYLDEFYDMVKDPRQVKREIVEGCLGRQGAMLPFRSEVLAALP
jgi:hypothetical protein